MFTTTFSGVSGGALAGGGIAVSTMRKRASKMLSFGFWVQDAALKPFVEVMGGLVSLIH